MTTYIEAACRFSHQHPSRGRERN